MESERWTKKGALSAYDSDQIGINTHWRHIRVTESALTLHNFTSSNDSLDGSLRPSWQEASILKVIVRHRPRGFYDLMITKY